MTRIKSEMAQRANRITFSQTDYSSSSRSLSLSYILGAFVVGMITNRLAEIQSYLILIPIVIFGAIGVIIKEENFPIYALVAFSFTPIPYLTSDARFHFISPINVFLLIMLFRVFKKISNLTKTLLLCGFGLLVALSSYSIFPARSMAWSLLLVLALFTLKVTNLQINKEMFFFTLRHLTTFLTLIVLIEYFLRSSIFNLKYPQIWTSEKYWSVWRTTSTLGHPINNGLFFCILLSFFCLPLARRHIKTGQLTLMQVFLLANVLTTGSRGAVLAALLILVISSFQNKKDNLKYDKFSKIVFSFLSLLLIIPIVQQFISRQNSKEGIESTRYRIDGLREFGNLVESIPIFGFGPGMGSQGYRILGNYGILENGIGQIIFAFGLAPSILIIIISIFASLKSFRKYKRISLSAIPLFSIFLSTNFISDNLTFLTLGALSIIIERSLRE